MILNFFRRVLTSQFRLKRVDKTTLSSPTIGQAAHKKFSFSGDFPPFRSSRPYFLCSIKYPFPVGVGSPRNHTSFLSWRLRSLPAPRFGGLFLFLSFAAEHRPQHSRIKKLMLLALRSELCVRMALEASRSLSLLHLSCCFFGLYSEPLYLWSHGLSYFKRPR